MPKIDIKNLFCSYYDEKGKGETPIFDNFSITFESKKRNVILGFSGCGKTTLLKCISGILDYDGEIYFDDLKIDDIDPKNRNLGFVRQEYVLYNHLTVFDNIAFPLKVINCSSDEIRRRVFEIARKLHIDHCLTRKPHQISGGQCQMVALARALVKTPSILLMDEPFSNVDEKVRDEYMKLLTSITDELGITVIYVTHNIKEALILGDHLYVLEEGKLIFNGNKEEIIKSKHPSVETLIYANENQG